MANSIATAYVQVVPTTDGIQAALSTEFGAAGAGAGKAMGGGILGAAKSFIGPLAAIFAVGSIVSFGRSAVEEASTLSESLNAVKVSFGDASAEITRLGEDSATRLGLSQSQFNGIATQFSAFAGTVAGAGGDVAGVIDTLSTRGADFASVMNLEVSDALGLFQSGLAGETEPLRRYGIDMSAAAVEAYAMANGIGEAGRELTEQEKVQARYGLLLEQTNKVQGDFANTSDGLANSQRITSARFADASAALGNSLMPIVQAITVMLADTFVPILETVGQWMAENPTVIIAVASALGIMAAALGIAAIAQWAMNSALLANPITWIILGITALVAAIIWLVMNWQSVVDFLYDVFKPAIDAVGAMFTWLWENALKPVVDAIAMAFTWLYENILRPVFLGIMLYIGLWAALFSFIYETVLKPIIDLIAFAFGWLYEYGIKPVIKWISDALGAMGKAFTDLYNGVIKPTFDNIGKAFEWVWRNIIKPVIGWINDAIGTIGNTVSSVFGAIGGFIKSVFEGIVGIIRGPVNAVIGFINTLIDGLNKIKINIPDWVPEWGGKSIGFNLSRIPMLADGGTVTGSGTVMVGERGPELLNLPRGAQVTPLDRAGGNTIIYNAAPNVSLDAEQALFTAMRRAKVVAGW
jgi:phage-related protein